MRSYGLYINGQYIHSNESRPVRGPQTPAGEPELAQLAWLAQSNPSAAELLEAALQGVSETFEQIRYGFFALDERLAFLKRFREKLAKDQDRVAMVLASEIGKPIGLARNEVERALSTIDWTLHEAPLLLRAEGLPVGFNGTSKGLEAYTLRDPRGPLLAISPFNFPLNLVLHKLLPAWAAGCPVILKPSPKAALVALTIADLAHSAELPAGMLSVINCDDGLTGQLCADARIKQISFTGSAKVGWSLAAAHSQKPVHLELGGTGPVYVDRSADLPTAAKKVAAGAFAFAGQVCISVQNIYVHRDVRADFEKLFKTEVESCAWGDPLLEGVTAGPVIDALAAARLRKLREEEIKQGTRVFAEAQSFKGTRPSGDSNYLVPTIFQNASPRLVRDEVFGPYANLMETPDLGAWVRTVNAFDYRFQTAIFAKDLSTVATATRQLDFGAVLVNEASHFRLEPMPFGGRGLSGNSREGPRYAIEAFTDLKSVVVRF